MTLVKANVDKMLGAVVTKLPGTKSKKKMLTALGAAARLEWIGLASDDLKTTSRDYIQGISQVSVRGDTATIRLTGVLPNMVENGWPPHDLRQTVLNSSKAKTSKAGGKYLAVPFRHGGPNTSGRYTGRPMPKQIFNVARRLEGTYNTPHHKAQGARLGLHMRMGRGARKILESKQRSWHTTSIYTGMIRKAELSGNTTFNKAGQSVRRERTTGFQTFRTISTNVRNGAQHWMHPGIKAKKLAPKVQKTIRQLSSKIIADASR
jgi:hypothetical protein